MRHCYRCRHCGNDFYLSEQDSKDYDDGFYTEIPDTCPSCEENLEMSFEYEMYSDSDIGL